MTASRKTSKNIDEYIAGFPRDIQERLEKIRSTIAKAAPGAEETIAWGMPTFRLNGNLVFFAAFKHHIGFFPTPSAIVKYRKELLFYEGGKGSVRFPSDKPIPLGLISKIVKFRVRENVEKATAKNKQKAKRRST